MPIRVGAETRRLSQEEFGRMAYELMDCVFQVHNELGRFFDERIYAKAISLRHRDARPEVAVDVTFEGFSKTYFLDLLVAGGAVFELKA
ncbi:MAG TPA: GxxExxY protein, partial [Planctomycetaceae bacterium]|nr:GxxExxY protein [Planctomycetaceae bacterium]